MAKRRDDEFYVGYLPQAPAGIARRVRLAIVLILLAALAVGFVLVRSQKRFAPSVFEFGVSRMFHGVVTAEPYPVLWVPRPHAELAPGTPPTVSAYLLVALGKHGAGELIADLDGQAVTIRGSLIYRDSVTMIEAHEIERDTSAIEDSRFAPPAPQDLGPQALVGEIVGSKCFLGVMKPGNLKPHRACAALCISGGVPPTLVVRGDDDHATYYLLASPEGRALNDQVLDILAEPVRIEGQVRRMGDLLLLEADPATFKRL